MHTLLLTCAGESTRFPDYPPKWAATHPSGNLMAAEAIRGISGWDRLVVALRGTHAERYGLEAVHREFALAGYQGAEVVVVGQTASHGETVAAAIERARIRGPVTAKDCDNYFELGVTSENTVAVVGVHESHARPENKSYVIPAGETVSSVVDRQVVSDIFACGAYTFADAELAASVAREVGPSSVTALVNALQNRGSSFRWQRARAYLDWGTQEDWQSFVGQFSTLFLDIDGVLLTAAHRSFAPRWGQGQRVTENVEAVNLLFSSGRVEIVLTTSRPEALRESTQRELSEAGLCYHRLIMGLRNCQRVVVNDVVGKRGETRARALNIERDRPVLGQMLREALR